MRTLYLLAGLLSDETIWTDVAGKLTGAANTQIVSFPDFQSIREMAEHVLRLAHGQFAIAGHSMGGRVALEVIRQAPQRVVGISLCNTGVHARRTQEIESRKRLVELAWARGMSALAAEWLPPMIGASTARMAEVMPRLTEMVERQTPQSFAEQINALLNREDATAILPTIRVPTLLASGSADTWSPLAQHEIMQRLVPHATLVCIEDAGHMSPIEQPEAVSAALRDWLKLL